MSTKQDGDWGEALVAEYLEARGCRIVEKEWRCRFGEIDLIAEQEGTLLFVEVKLRSNLRYGMPRESVTAKKQEKLRLETEKETVRANLLRAMSHDIRTPLTSIVGNTAAILDNEDSFSPEQKRRLLEDVNEDAQWLIRMVENLLSITRMSGGQAKIEKECEAAEEIIAVSVSKFTKRFPNIQVTVEVPDEVLMVPMDATLIRQVMMNLLENAVFHAKGMENLRLRVEVKGSWAYFYVEDDGCGIPEEYQQSIFQPFFRVDRSRNREYGGAGLGLSLVWEIADLHGGCVWVEASSEKGSTIAVELPVQ